MDCEKFETTLIDELYEELDELTSAAAKRHVAGCARCSALLGGLRATRRIAVLPMVEPSADLEDRILSAAKDAQKVVPMRRRFGSFISLAGSWAMRPQTAMAATFLLMVGMTALFMQGRKASAPANGTMTITAEGAPAASAAAPMAALDDTKLDPATAAAAHGAGPVATTAPAATATAAASASAATDESQLAYNDTPAAQPPMAQSPPPARAAKPSSDYRTYGSLAGGSGGGPANAAAPAGAPYPQQGYAQNSPYAQAQPASPADKKADSRGSAFDSAMSLYRAGSFVDATRAFDALAAGGDQGAALWAARSVRDGNGGCGPAVSRFDQIAQATFGTNVGFDATLEGGRCYSAMGSMDQARSRFTRLLTAPDYASRAQAEIDALSQGQVAQRQESAAKPKAAARPAAPPPAKASPPPTAVQKQSSGF